MSVRYLSPSNPGATTQAERDAAATANWNAIKAAANASDTTAPVHVGPAGARQGIVRCKPGIWWLQPGNQMTPGNGFDNTLIQFAPGATTIASDDTAGFIFTMTQGLTNCEVNGGAWPVDGAEPAAPTTMTNKTGAGWPTIAPNLGGGDPAGPSVTANGDPRVPWTYPVSDMMSVGVDKLKWPWINNHCGFINAQKCTDCGHDRQFYFGYREATSSGAAMMVPRATAGSPGTGVNSPHNFQHNNQFMINAPQGFGVNQWTDCRGFNSNNIYCCGGEAFRMETHKPNDGGIHDGVASRIAQAGGNVGIAMVPHQARNGTVRIDYVWNHSSEYGAFKLKTGSSPTTGIFGPGSRIRHFTSIGGNKTWAQKQDAPAGGSEGNTPELPQRACFIQGGLSWRANVAIGGDVAFGHMNNISTTGGIAVGAVPGVAQGFEMGSGFGGANASDGIQATTRDLTGPHPDDGPVIVDTDINHEGTLTPHGVQTFVNTTPVIGDLTGRTGSLAPTGSHLFTKLDVNQAAPEWDRTPTDPSTSQAAFFRATLTSGQVGQWRWRIDDGPIELGAPTAEFDYRTFPVAPGEHTVVVDVVKPNGSVTVPLEFTWLVPRIEVPTPSPDDLLGCGLYTVYVCARGGGKPLFSLPFTSLDWERCESATGQASVIVDGISNYGADCCQRMAEIQPWKHEIRIYRDARSIWVGPVVQRTIDGDQGKVVARDLSTWAARRRVGKSLTHTQADLSVVARDYWNDGLSRDKSPNIRLATYLTGTLADRAVEADKVLVDSQIAELVRSGLSWSVISRTIVLGIRQGQTQAVARLLDSSFVVEPGTDEDGSDQTNDLIVLGEGAGEGAEQPHGQARDQGSAVEFGLLEDVVSESEIKDDASAAANARTQVALLADPPATISGGTLSQIAPVTIDELVAGAPVDIRLSQTCVPVAGIYRMVKIGGSASADGSEAIKLDVEMISLG